MVYEVSSTHLMGLAEEVLINLCSYRRCR